MSKEKELIAEYKGGIEAFKRVEELIQNPPKHTTLSLEIISLKTACEKNLRELKYKYQESFLYPMQEFICETDQESAAAEKYLSEQGFTFVKQIAGEKIVFSFRGEIWHCSEIYNEISKEQ